MQSHLSMRIGKWDKTCDWALHAVELEQKYQKDVGVKASEDDQFSHHLETLTIALIHDGRYEEAKRIRKVAESAKDEAPGTVVPARSRRGRLERGPRGGRPDEARQGDAELPAGPGPSPQGQATRALPEINVLARCTPASATTRSSSFGSGRRSANTWSGPARSTAGSSCSRRRSTRP